ncbi:MAG: hypothetical protein ACYDD9_04500 [Acidithiobacillus sp.]|uniref:Uncharacterized protein n=1 Tax=Acidithiobacillus ferruginosus TaxID=3063951 RepID=A0ACD5IK79_9PROT|nr:hypothetical protein [Acidithiobacillus ferruginosus]
MAIEHVSRNEGAKPERIDLAITCVTLSNFNDDVILLSPLAERHRIVAKVDELMALCDTLKARLADAQATQLHLADAIVEQAVC